MPPPDPVLRTRLHIPTARQGLVARPRLLDRFGVGLQAALTLVTAPAGYGKTTLVIASLAALGLPAAWLSLDQEDNAPERFLNDVLHAIRQRFPQVGSATLQALATDAPVSLEHRLTGLLNEIDDLEGQIILVLDDYHRISSSAVHAGLVFLLDHCPSTLHIVITTRADPPFPLARWRSRGQVVELRAADLRFTGDEAAQFFRDTMGLDLDAPVVQVFAERTEGWIAGLQMAALSLRNRANVQGFLESFSGTNRYLLDYLLEEVLANQPPEVQRFLLITSILERMCAPLCDALFTAGQVSEAASQAMIDLLDRSNLFLVALDEERRWYRYHHLFADLLRSRLKHTYPGLDVELHRRAADWFEQAGLPVEAINHALAGGAHDQAARLVEENTTRLLSLGEIKALMRWIDLFPEDLRNRYPSLGIQQAYALTFAGQLTAAEDLLLQVEVAAAAREQPPAQIHRLQAAIAALRSMIAVMAGRDQEGIALAHWSRERLAEDQDWDRATTAWALGFAARSRGNLAQANAAFTEMAQLARKMGNLWTLVTSFMDLAMVVRAQGQLTRAQALFEDALRVANQQGAGSYGYMARMEVGLASIHYERNDLSKAQQFLTAAFAHIQQWPNPNHLTYAYLVQTRVKLANADLSGARESIALADQVRQTESIAPINRQMVESGLVRVWLRQAALHASGAAGVPQDAALASACTGLIAGWQAAIAALAPVDFDEGSLSAALMLTRVALFRQQAAQSLTLLRGLAERALTMGNIAAALEALLLTALAQHSAAQEQAAFSSLEAALRLAQPEQFVRTVLDEGEPLRHLLARASAHDLDPALRSYADFLLVQWEAEATAAPLANRAQTPAASVPVPRSAAEYPAFPETLSAREREVLGLIALGLTNADVARELVLSIGTVKAHTAAIFRKLDVSNRTEAVARARQRHLLP